MTTETRAKTDGFESLGKYLACEFCDSTRAVLSEASTNFNGGDGLIDSHAHINVVYVCENGHEFVIRGYVHVTKLYYGDLDPEHGILDMGPEKQEEVAKKSDVITTQAIGERWEEVTGTKIPWRVAV